MYQLINVSDKSSALESTSQDRTDTTHNITLPKTLRRPSPGSETTPAKSSSNHVPLSSKTLRQPCPEPKSPPEKSPSRDQKSPAEMAQPASPSPQEQVPSPERVKPLSSKTMRRQHPQPEPGESRQAGQEPQTEAENRTPLSSKTLRRPHEEKREKRSTSIFGSLLPSPWKPKAATESEQVPSEGATSPQPTSQTYVKTSQLPGTSLTF